MKYIVVYFRQNSDDEETYQIAKRCEEKGAYIRLGREHNHQSIDKSMGQDEITIAQNNWPRELEKAKSVCKQLNDMSIKKREGIENYKRMCMRGIKDGNRFCCTVIGMRGKEYFLFHSTAFDIACYFIHNGIVKETVRHHYYSIMAESGEYMVLSENDHDDLCAWENANPMLGELNGQSN